MVRYILLPDWMTDEAKKYTGELVQLISNGVCNLIESSGVYVCKVPEERIGLLEYLTSIDALQDTPADSMNEICPEALVIGQNL